VTPPDGEPSPDVEIVSGGRWPDDVERLLRMLPDWFGIEESNRNYVEAARSLPGVAAVLNGRVVGVGLVRHHTPEAAEIELLLVEPSLHRHGIGRRIVDTLARDLAGHGVELLQVKTFGPSGDSEPYERTRAFYRSMGFVPLEERTDIWGPENPCLISVLPLGGRRAGS
jgi:GNAT superfamily N-acetyltransferase